MNSTIKTVSTAIIITAAVSVSAIAHAAGGGSGETTTTTKPDPAKACQLLGKVYNKQTKKCEKKEAVLDQDSLFEGGRAFAYAGQYEKALAILALAPDQLDPRVLNLKGFSHRKMGQIEKGIAYYKHSIAVDPQYALVREYYGEALLQLGDLAAAENQLSMIREICESEACEPYQQLQTAIADYRNGLSPEQRNTSRW